MSPLNTLKSYVNNDDIRCMITSLTDNAINQAVDAILTSHDARHGDYWLNVYDYNPFTDSLLEGLLSSITGVANEPIA